MLVTNTALFALSVLFSLVALYYLLYCLHRLRVTLTIQLKFPVICLLNACIKTALFALTGLLWVVVLYYRLSCLLFVVLLIFVSTLTSCNSYYPGDIPVICLLNACIKTALFALTALHGCSVLSTILFTQTSCNSYYPVDIPCNLFTECLFQRLTCLHYYLVFIGCSLLSTILSTLTLCKFTNPVDIPCNLFTKCLLQTLPYLHCLSCFHWLLRL